MARAEGDGPSILALPEEGGAFCISSENLRVKADPVVRNSDGAFLGLSPEGYFPANRAPFVSTTPKQP